MAEGFNSSPLVSEHSDQFGIAFAINQASCVGSKAMADIIDNCPSPLKEQSGLNDFSVGEDSSQMSNHVAENLEKKDNGHFVINALSQKKVEPNAEADPAMEEEKKGRDDDNDDDMNFYKSIMSTGNQFSGIKLHIYEKEDITRVHKIKSDLKEEEEVKQGDKVMTVGIVYKGDAQSLLKSCKEVRNLGKGAHGLVYQVRGEDGILYALKLYKREHERDFVKEVSILSALNGAEFPRVLGLIVNSELYGFIMEMGASTLWDFAKYTRKTNKQPSGGTLFRILVTLIEEIRRIHSAGLCHRDIKPQNIILQDDTLMLIDYSLAVYTKPVQKPGNLAGTLGYIDPRIMKKKDREYSEVDLRLADFFSLGVTLLVLAFPSFVPKQGELVLQIEKMLKDLSKNLEYECFHGLLLFLLANMDHKKTWSELHKELSEEIRKFERLLNKKVRSQEQLSEIERASLMSSKNSFFDFDINGYYKQQKAGFPQSYALTGEVPAKILPVAEHTYIYLNSIIGDGIEQSKIEESKKNLPVLVKNYLDRECEHTESILKTLDMNPILYNLLVPCNELANSNPEDKLSVYCTLLSTLILTLFLQQNLVSATEMFEQRITQSQDKTIRVILINNYSKIRPN